MSISFLLVTLCKTIVRGDVRALNIKYKYGYFVEMHTHRLEIMNALIAKKIGI
tara:strand:- start:28768 stop:28926 length:159 start_codon:yes stop_codon:yes gene_type:complete